MKKLLCLILALLLCVSLVACGDLDKDEKDEEETEEQEATQETEVEIAGYYRFVRMDDNGEITTAKDVEEHDDDDTLDGYYAHMFRDGTGVMCIFGQPEDITWDETRIYSAGRPEQNYEYTYKNGTLSMGDSAQTIYFEKVCEEFTLTDEAEAMVGTYYFHSQTQDGQTFDRDDLEDQDTDYKDIYLKLYDDGTAKVDGDVAMLWNENYLWYEEDKDCSDCVTMQLDGDLLKLESADSTLFYEKN